MSINQLESTANRKSASTERQNSKTEAFSFTRLKAEVRCICSTSWKAQILLDIEKLPIFRSINLKWLLIGFHTTEAGTKNTGKLWVMLKWKLVSFQRFWSGSTSFRWIWKKQKATFVFGQEDNKVQKKNYCSGTGTETKVSKLTLY